MRVTAKSQQQKTRSAARFVSGAFCNHFHGGGKSAIKVHVYAIAELSECNVRARDCYGDLFAAH